MHRNKKSDNKKSYKVTIQCQLDLETAITQAELSHKSTRTLKLKCTRRLIHHESQLCQWLLTSQNAVLLILFSHFEDHPAINLKQRVLKSSQHSD